MKKIISAFILVLTLACFSVVGVYAAVVEKPVIEAEMPDCYMEIGSGSIVLYANATVPDGGTVRYQWYVADTENMAMIHAVFGAESDIYQVPEEIGVKWYCYAAWNVSGGVESDPVYSRLIRVCLLYTSSGSLLPGPPTGAAATPTSLHFLRCWG